MKILFLTPYGIRSGSEMALWNIMNSLNRSKYKMRLFCKSRGDLLTHVPDDIAFDISKYQLSSFKSRLANRLSTVILRKGLLESQLTKIQNEFQADFWYINTSVLPELALIATNLKIPYAVHFHEMESVYSSFKDYMMEKMVMNAKVLIACSKSVYSNLEIMGGRNIEILYEAVDIEKICSNWEQRTLLRSQYGIEEDEFVWGMSGATSYRKGFDLFLKVAKEFKSKARFVWIGRERDLGFDYYVKRMVKFYGMSHVIITGEKNEDYYDHLNMLDGFILTSREDPFPLVMIGAGYLGKPIISFDSGGAREFVIEGTGRVTTGINLGEMIEGMNEVMSNYSNYNKEGIINNARRYNLKDQLLKWEEIIEKHFVVE